MKPAFLSLLSPFFVFALAFVSIECNFDDGGHMPQPKPARTVYVTPGLSTETRVVPPFSGISVLWHDFHVYLKQDTVQSVLVESNTEVIDSITTQVTDGILVINLPSSYRGDVYYWNATINIYISITEISQLEGFGGSQLLTTSPIHSDQLTCHITGGNIRLSGIVGQLIVVLAGGWDRFYGFDLSSSNCSITISGDSAFAQVNATKSLTAKITGAGNIVYAGNPPVVQEIVQGFGTIKPM